MSRICNTSVLSGEIHPTMRRSDAVIGNLGAARVPATCGELVQGFAGTQDFLINCPISLMSQVRVRITASGRISIRTPGCYFKTARAVRLALDFLGFHNLGASIEIISQVPRGKGLASSTSEIAAAIGAVLQAVGSAIPSREVASIIAQIDPSDNVHYKGIVLCDPLSGYVHESMPTPKNIGVIVVDTGGEVDTIEVDRGHLRKTALAAHKELAEAVSLVRLGLELNNPYLVGRGATISSLVNQRGQAKPEFEALYPAIVRSGAVGINSGHTGTVLGVLFDVRNEGAFDELRIQIEREVGPNAIIGNYHLVSGGYYECH